MFAESAVLAVYVESVVYTVVYLVFCAADEHYRSKQLAKQ